MHNHSLDREDVDTKFYGNRRGRVIDNKDPLGAGRIKVRINGVYDDIPEEVIPWATYSDPFMGGSGSGGAWVPDVGVDVWTFFEAGDHMQPVYFGGAPSASTYAKSANKTTQPNDFPSGVDYPNNRVISTKSGHVIEIDDSAGNSRIRISHKSGTQYIIVDNGDVFERVVGNKTLIVQGSVFEYVSGDYKSNTLGNYDMRGSRIDLNKAAPESY